MAQTWARKRRGKPVRNDPFTKADALAARRVLRDALPTHSPAPPIIPAGEPILIKDFAQPATAWWQTSSRSLNLHLPRLTVEAAVGDKVKRLHGTVLSQAGLSSMLEAQLLRLANIAHG